MSLGTLAAVTAVSILAQHGTGILNAYLMKKVHARIWAEETDSNDMFLVGMARGGASVTEIKSAIEISQLDRSKKNQASVRDVLMESLTLLGPGNDGGGTLNKDLNVSLGGGNGIPFDEGEGWQWFVYNIGQNAFVAGSFVGIDATYFGAWLGN